MDRREAVSAIEVLVAVTILGLLLVPTYDLFLQGRQMGLRSHLTYLALQAAREEIEDLRVLATFSQDPVADLAHDWRPVEGGLFGRLGQLAEGLDGPELAYPSEYSRIHTRVTLEPKPGGRVFRGVLNVRWQERGEALTEQDVQEKQGVSRFDFLLVRPTGD